MKAGIFYGPHDIRVEEVPDPSIQKPTDALVKVLLTCICGSDLWYYRGLSEKQKGSSTGHEFLGVVEQIGEDVSKVKAGDYVVAPFTDCDGTCPACRNGVSSACWNGRTWGNVGIDGGQGEKVRVPFADASLFPFPKDTPESLWPSILTLSDVLDTGYHAAKSAGVGKGQTVAVIGDGAVGLCAVLSSRYLGAKRIILFSRNSERIKVGKQFGATDIIEKRGDEGIADVLKMTDEVGVDAALECVGTDASWEQAFGIVRAGGKIGFVGVPHGVELPVTRMFRKNIGVVGGVAPAASYIPQLMPDVLSGELDPGAVFDLTLPLSDLAKGYEAMDQRQAIKVLIKP